MNPKEAKKLGARLRNQREALELNVRDLADRTGIDFSTIARIERGVFDQPRPEKLAALAEALGLDSTEILKLAKYPTLTTMPAPRTYLRAKYRDLNSDQLEALHKDIERVLEKHGINPTEPEFGEDEQPEPRSSNSKKGGKR